MAFTAALFRGILGLFLSHRRRNPRGIAVCRTPPPSPFRAHGAALKLMGRTAHHLGSHVTNSFSLFSLSDSSSFFFSPFIFIIARVIYILLSRGDVGRLMPGQSVVITCCVCHSCEVSEKKMAVWRDERIVFSEG